MSILAIRGQFPTPQKNDSVINDSIKLPALTETPLQCAWHKVCSGSYVPLIPLPTILPEKHFFSFPF